MQVRRDGIILVVMIVLVCGAGAFNVGAKKKEPKSPGEISFRAHCKTCHALPRPKKWRDDEWPLLVARYGERANLDSAQIEMITQFVTLVNDPEPEKKR